MRCKMRGSGVKLSHRTFDGGVGNFASHCDGLVAKKSSGRGATGRTKKFAAGRGVEDDNALHKLKPTWW